ncbi:hypothetical protein [Aeromicrobium sp. Sec7.5]|uniref:hypothetical protein n=1 Tax=Aeromicrobium sp. Sec7.5 TaxID=3121276 RepID=UPI002FE45D01
MPRPATRPRAPWIALSVLVSCAVYALVNVRWDLTSGSRPFLSLRAAYGHDQLGYLAIVTNVANGDLSASEPVTQTGSSYYPRGYYSFVGLVARTLGVHPITAWNLVSVGLQILAVALLAVALVVLSRRWWIGLLAPLPFTIGTLSMVTGGDWLTDLNSHAVLWGPFGLLFSNNADTAALMVITMVLSVAALAVHLGVAGGRALAIAIACGAAVGLLASFHAYTFIVAVYFLTIIVSSHALVSGRLRRSAIATAVILVAVLVAGPWLDGTLGQIPMFGLGLLAAVPGAVAALRRMPGVVLGFTLAVLAFSGPSLGWLFYGIASGDEFLSFRTVTTNDLSVAMPVTLLASLPVLLPLLLLLAISRRRRDDVSTAALLGALASWILLATNDLWGPDAEPYRFWIDCYAVTAIVVVLVLGRLVGGRTAAATPTGDAPATGDTPASGRYSRFERPATIGAAVVCAAVIAVSFADIVEYQNDPRMLEAYDPHLSRETAIGDIGREASERDPEGLVTADPCVDLRTLKINSGARVANYHLGMAWPDDKESIDDVLDARNDSEIDAAAMRASDTRWIVVDMNCQYAWQDDPELELVDTASWDAGVIGLYRLDP